MIGNYHASIGQLRNARRALFTLAPSDGELAGVEGAVRVENAAGDVEAVRPKRTVRPDHQDAPVTQRHHVLLRAVDVDVDGAGTGAAVGIEDARLQAAAIDLGPGGHEAAVGQCLDMDV